MGDDLDGGVKDRQYYLEQAYQNAFGTYDESDWDPVQGFAKNRPRILKLYDYYRDVYLKAPDVFLWAGLGRMAGGDVVNGLDQTVSTLGEGNITQGLVQGGKAIFSDLAPMHEAYLDDPSNAISLATDRDSQAPKPTVSYAQAWQDIASGDPDRIISGNFALLQNEQFSIVQPIYDKLVGDNTAFLNSTRAFTYNVHPYHRDFLLDLPQGDVLIAKDRWTWITLQDGMWDKWAKMPGIAPDERTRLVSLDFGEILARRFGPTVDALLPPGGNDEDA